MTVEESLISHLVASGIVGSRVFAANQLQQGAGLPALAVQRISTVPSYAHQGISTFRIRLQISVFGATWQSQLETSLALKRAMESFRVGGCRYMIGIDIGREQGSTLYVSTNDYELIVNDLVTSTS